MAIINIALWQKADEKDKTDNYPQGEFMLSGNMTIEIPADITFKAGSKIGLSIRRNRQKVAGDKAPDFRGELYPFVDRP